MPRTYSNLARTSLLSPGDVLTLGLLAPTPPGGGAGGVVDGGSGAGGGVTDPGTGGAGSGSGAVSSTGLAGSLTDALASVASVITEALAALEVARASGDRTLLDDAANNLGAARQAQRELLRAQALTAVLA